MHKFFIYLHRYTGLLMSILFFIWFFSGIFMVFTDFPSVSDAEKLKYQKKINWEKVKVSPAEAANNDIISFSLTMMGEVPVYRCKNKRNKYVIYRADNGKRIDSIGIIKARHVVAKYFDIPVSELQVARLDQRDQWTPQGKYQKHLPLYKFRLQDEKGSCVYISGRSGEIVQQHTRQERIMAWLGPIPHWIYLRDLRVHRSLWGWVVMILSGIGILVTISGVVIGLWHARRKPKKFKKGLSPYAGKWMRWHHYTGLIFGLFVFIWILSGFFSMSPGNYESLPETEAKIRKQWRGCDFQIKKFKAVPDNLASHKVKAVHGRIINNKPFYIYQDQSAIIGHKEAGQGRAVLKKRFARDFLFQSMENVLPEFSQKQPKSLQHYDNYYYDEQNKKPLPVWKVNILEKGISYYVDPVAGNIVYITHLRNKIHRWLYQGLHTWDFSASWYQGWIRKGLMLAALIIGTFLCLTSIILTFRWIKKRFT